MILLTASTIPTSQALRYSRSVNRFFHHFTIRSNNLLSRHASVSSFSDPSARSTAVTKNVNDEKKDIVFYERSPSRNMFPRVCLGMSTLHSVYWTWYVADFIPAINASASAVAESANIAPSVGYLGLGVALTINFFAGLYPKALVTKMTMGGNGRIKLWAYNLPFVTVMTEPQMHSIGDIFMDPTSVETKRILNKYDGLVELFRGIMTVQVKGRRTPHLIEIREEDEVIQNPALFMQAMMNPDLVTKDLSKMEMKEQKQLKKKPKRRKGKLVKRT